jgi:DNA-binding NarL/FixJ family response regulator
MKESRTLLVVDDHGVVHFGLHLLAEEEGFSWREGAKTPAEALRLIGENPPDILVLDLVLGGRDRLDLLAEVRRLAPETRVVVYSSLPEETYAARVFRLGAWAFVPKSGEMEELRAALRAVDRGEIWARPAVLRQLSGAGQRGTPGEGAKQEALSDRELHVFRLLGEGKRPRSIADELKLSVKTVHTYCDRLKLKLDCSSLETLQQRAAEEREW